MDSAFPSKPPSPALRSSWARSRAHGLSPDQPLPDVPVAHAELADRLEANARLLTFSRPAIENLYQQIGNPSSTVLLADRDGLILSAVGCPDFLDRAGQVALSPGARWREADVGTNAIGTALHTGGFTAVRGAEHYLDRNRFLTCVATPILAPSGGILGILDVSTDARADLSHANALLHTTAELIEHRLIETMNGGFLSVHFHNRPDLIGSPLEALAVFDEDGRLIASNRAARRLLALDPRHPAARCDECFATPWGGLVGWAALRQNRPFPVRTLRGLTCCALARLRIDRRKPHPDPRPGDSPNGSRVQEMALGDARIAAIIASLKDFGPASGPLLIEGETGSGKTHLTQALHEDRRTDPAGCLVTLDCATLTPDAHGLAEALAALRQASGGTLVLRQVGHLRAEHQMRLYAAGVAAPATQLIATTTTPVAALTASGRFARDAFDAHGGQTVQLPPLRERNDFDALTRRFVRELCADRHVYVCPDAVTRLRRHNWPGNLTELRSRLRLILALIGDDAGQLCPEDIPDELFDDDSAAGP